MSNLKRIQKISDQDIAIANVIFAKDCIYSGNLPGALQAMEVALTNLTKTNARHVDNEVLRLLGG